MSNNVFVKSGRVTDILAATVAATVTGSWMYKDAPKAAIQVVATAAATVEFEVSNDGVNPLATLLGTVTLVAAGSDGFTTDAPWKYIRAKVTANSGTVNVTMSV
jgi:FlaG/FlaF family flagellin (archaellin)